jgi:NhaA family Na+:H+ antiporter
MSLFIADLAFESAAVLESAKAGILGASVLSGIMGWVILRRQGSLGGAETRRSEEAGTT